MKRLISGLLCMMISIALNINAYAATSVPESVIDGTKSVVRILAEYSDWHATGSGFVIKSNEYETLIITNYHVLEGNPHSISVWVGEEETVNATILAYTSQKDMCILRLDYPMPLQPLWLDNDGVGQGEAVYAVGFPSSADALSDKDAHISTDATITDGIVSAVREATISGYGTPTKILQINAAINPGSSGGPLLNSDGRVVGISTYGIDGSQGIFGAIDIGELKSFLADQSISIPLIAADFPWLTIFIVCGIGIVAIPVIVFSCRKKIVTGNIMLSKYMESHPNGMGVNNAVAMLLPVAIRLRDLHSVSSSHLQVSPSSIFVGSRGAMLIEATSAEADRYSSGYAAPEIYRGTTAGIRSDIYSFCAVLMYVAYGKQPLNALRRTETAVETADIALFDSAFAAIIQSGLALNPEERPVSMQEVINSISPYNTQPFDGTKVTDNQDIESQRTKNRSGVRLLIIAIGIMGIIAAVMVGIYYGCYTEAKKNAQNGNFTVAENLLIVPSITMHHDASLLAYIDAGKLLDERKYEEAKSAFEKLSGYLCADEMTLEASYRNALQYADANDFETAISILTKLSEIGYKDSTEKIDGMQFRKGVYLLQEKEDFIAASTIFAELREAGYDGAEDMEKESHYVWALYLLEKEIYTDAYEKLLSIRDYADAEEYIKVLEETMYYGGRNLYYEGKYHEAREMFECISPYADSENFIILLDARLYSEPIFSKQKEVTETLVSIFYFEDASEVLLSEHGIAKEFLCGTWNGDGYYFVMEEDGHTSYDLPRIKYGDYYRIEDGIMLLYPDGEHFNTRALFDITALSPDCIEVFCYKNNQSYTLYRQ